MTSANSGQGTPSSGDSIPTSGEPSGRGGSSSSPNEPNPTKKADDSMASASTPSPSTSFDETYVKGLRQEAKRNRERYEKAEARAVRMERRVLEAAVATVATKLADPSDLLSFVEPADLLDDDGDPDDDKIEAAVEELLKKKSHLSRQRQAALVEVGQGQSVASSNGDGFGEWMRSTAT